MSLEVKNTGSKFELELCHLLSRGHWQVTHFSLPYSAHVYKGDESGNSEEGCEN